MYYHCLVLEMVQCDKKGWTVEDQVLPCFRRIGIGDMRFREREDGFPLEHDTGEPRKGGENWVRAMHTHQTHRDLILV